MFVLLGVYYGYGIGNLSNDNFERLNVFIFIKFIVFKFFDVVLGFGGG